ncbi:unnamed protein product, partial [Durusdinium trenchii]
MIIVKLTKVLQVMVPWGAQLLPAVIFQALSASATAKVGCHSECKKPHCVEGAAWNGGLPLSHNVCEHICSRKFGETRYCGESEKYSQGDSVNCTLCSGKDLDSTADSVEVAAPQRIREAILKEAQHRLVAWYDDQDELTLPYWEFKAKVQQTKHWYSCDPNGDMKVPVTFGEFNVSDVRPAELFEVLTDLEGQLKWDNSISEAEVIKEFPEDGVLAAELVFPSGIWLVPPRQVFQWMAFKASLKNQEYWFAVSSLNVETIHEVHKPNKFAVQAENCLGAYWIQPCPPGGETSCPAGNPYSCCPEGGSRIRFTSHVNLHPPNFLNAKTIFDMGWTKQIDWINALKNRAREMKKHNDARIEETVSANATPTLPKWLWHDPAVPKRGSVPFDFPREMVSVARLYQRSSIFSMSFSQPPLMYFPLAALLSVLLVFAIRVHRTTVTRGDGEDSRGLMAVRSRQG